ncbi:hypothetical protein [Rhizobium sp. 007]|uniref:hypothetical protein n=1 Tax=Rhizobium sp. 007 TaxID=2785056 RepID=UPI00188F59DE|nr:hypothetical protein [Rhizobium sp. 007]QPB24443.1 hypothetical protein ISN39_33335 [Rhizobium sp. 007]
MRWALRSPAKRQANSAEVQAIHAETQAAAAKSQASLAERQLADLQKKIGMVTDPEKMFEILPIWYIERMGRDDWGFGLLLTSSEIMAVARIEAISSERQWMEVTMLEKGQGPVDINDISLLYAPTDRLKASVRIANVEAAFELWTS